MSLPPSTPAVECDGFGPGGGSDPCTIWPGVVGPVFRDGVYRRPFVANALFGFEFDLEVEVRADGTLSNARFCRSELSDVNGECPVANWTCATAGTIALSEIPDESSVRQVHGEIHVSFPEGQMVDGTF